MSLTRYGIRWRMQFFIYGAPFKFGYAFTQAGALRKAKRVMKREISRENGMVWYNLGALIDA